MSAIHVETLVEALERPSTLPALIRKTGYSLALVLQYMQEARASGVTIRAVPRGTNSTYELTYYELVRQE